MLLIYLVCRIQLATFFALITFCLNFVPNFGAMITVLSPVPVIILDKNISQTQGLIAFFLPALVHIVVGNVVEPLLYESFLTADSRPALLRHGSGPGSDGDRGPPVTAGRSGRVRKLTIHPVVVLLSLCIWFIVWGVIGAVLAVPIVAILQLVLEEIREFCVKERVAPNMYKDISLICDMLQGHVPGFTLGDEVEDVKTDAPEVDEMGAKDY